jgi:hypothetical protein
MLVQNGRLEDGADTFPEMVIPTYQCTQHHTPADYNLNVHFREKHKFYKGNILFSNY